MRPLRVSNWTQAQHRGDPTMELGGARVEPGDSGPLVRRFFVTARTMRLGIILIGLNGSIRFFSNCCTAVDEAQRETPYLEDSLRVEWLHAR